MATEKQIEADRIDAELVRLSGRAASVGLEELSLRLFQLRALARSEMSAQQLKDAPY